MCGGGLSGVASLLSGVGGLSMLIRYAADVADLVQGKPAGSGQFDAISDALGGGPAGKVGASLIDPLGSTITETSRAKNFSEGLDAIADPTHGVNYSLERIGEIIPEAVKPAVKPVATLIGTAINPVGGTAAGYGVGSHLLGESSQEAQLGALIAAALAYGAGELFGGSSTPPGPTPNEVVYRNMQTVNLPPIEANPDLIADVAPSSVAAPEAAPVATSAGPVFTADPTLEILPQQAPYEPGSSITPVFNPTTVGSAGGIGSEPFTVKDYLKMPEPTAKPFENIEEPPFRADYKLEADAPTSGWVQEGIRAAQMLAKLLGGGVGGSDSGGVPGGSYSWTMPGSTTPINPDETISRVGGSSTKSKGISAADVEGPSYPSTLAAALARAEGYDPSQLYYK